MKRLTLILAVLLSGCATTHNIYNMDIEAAGVELVDSDNVVVVLSRESSLQYGTLQNEFINYNVWQVSAINTSDECIKLNLAWNLSGFVYKPVVKYTTLQPNTATPVGLLVDEIVTYNDFTYALRGYGRIRKLNIKKCK